MLSNDWLVPELSPLTIILPLPPKTDSIWTIQGVHFNIINKFGYYKDLDTNFMQSKDSSTQESSAPLIMLPLLAKIDEIWTIWGVDFYPQSHH